MVCEVLWLLALWHYLVVWPDLEKVRLLGLIFGIFKGLLNIWENLIRLGPIVYANW